MNNKLKSLIVLRFGTQSDFSRNLKVREARVSRIVQGRDCLSDDEKQKWAALLGVNSCELFEKEAANEAQN